jgi:hypothetical protein
MISPEVFYVHIQGEQRGPYTILQIDHMLNSGLIALETLYWREGMDQWQPVTDLVVVRKKINPWIKPGIALAILLVLAVLVQMFGPITLEGWRETNQHAFTAPGAYWRARDVVRNGALPRGSVVTFGKYPTAQVEMQAQGRAMVTVRGEVTASSGMTTSHVWRVPMQFEPRSREWSGGPPQEVTP